MLGLDIYADKVLIGVLKVLAEINRGKQVIGYIDMTNVLQETQGILV